MGMLDGKTRMIEDEAVRDDYGVRIRDCSAALGRDKDKYGVIDKLDGSSQRAGLLATGSEGKHGGIDTDSKLHRADKIK